MTASRSRKQCGGGRWRSPGRVCLLLTVILLLTPGCDDKNLIAFRDAAADGLRTGVNSIMGGVVDGIFAAVLGDATDNASGNSATPGSGG